MNRAEWRSVDRTLTPDSSPGLRHRNERGSRAMSMANPSPLPPTDNDDDETANQSVPRDERHWVSIQRSTFTNWVRDRLAGDDEETANVVDLQTDLRDGWRLCRLMEALQHRRVAGHATRRPTNRHQRIDNINLALQAMVDDGIRLINIAAEDIIEGNLKLILGLIWRLILRYQIARRGRASPKKLMLSWINSVLSQSQQQQLLPTHISNFTTDWNDGTALHGLLDYCKPGLSPNWRTLSRREGLQNCRHAMELAKNQFNVPIVLQPEDLSSADLDEMSGMTYISYFTKPDSPGYNATLSWVQRVIPKEKIRNFQTDWNDGRALTALVRALGGEVNTSRPPSDPTTAIQNAMDAGKQLGIEPVITASEMAEQEVDHLGIMAYVARFQQYASAVGQPMPQHQPQLQEGVSHSKNTKMPTSPPSSARPVGGGHVTNGETANERLPVSVAKMKLEVGSKQPVKASAELNRPKRRTDRPVDLDQMNAENYDENYGENRWRRSPTPPPSPSDGDRLAVVMHSQTYFTGRQNMFELTTTDGKAVTDTSAVRVLISGPNAVLPAVLEWQDGDRGARGKTKAICKFVPMEAGQHKIAILYKDKICPKSTAKITAVADISPLKLSTAVPTGQVGKPLTFKVTTSSNGPGSLQLARDDVHAEAVSPSGRRYAVDVIQKADGTYSANFTPSESGDWQISILHGNQHIQGSPFSVRVQEPAPPPPANVKIHGLDDRRIVGRLANFSIETQESASGELVVDVTYQGRSIPAQIEPDSRTRYHVSFTPVGSGTYTIRVYFSGVEVTGSPFKMDIIDASEVQVTGDCLTAAEANRRSTFYVDLGRNGSSRDLQVRITSPRGTVPANIHDGRGNVAVDFVPTEAGDHHIDVSYFGKPVTGSPFRCSVFDWSKINVHNLPMSGSIDRTIDFDIDASQAGTGSLEIMVNEGSVPCNVQNLGGRRFRASFTPTEPIFHTVRMTFNGYAVPGSPWRVDVRSPASITVAGSGLHQMSVGRPAVFEIHSNQSRGDVVVNVTSPTRRTTRANVVSLGNGSYRVEYVPMEVGSHQIEVLYDGMLVAGSPFTSKAFNVSAIAVSPINMGVVGLPVEFSIDVSQAGEGQLEIMVNRGMVQNTVRALGRGLFAVSFIPRDTRPHSIDILFNNEPIAQGAITVPIMNRGGDLADNIRETAVNRNSFFQFRNPTVSEADIVVRVTSPTGELVPAKMVPQPDGDYKVEYSSKFTGRHTVEILSNGQAIMGSPFFVEIYDPNKIRIEGLKSGMVNERMEFDIIRHQAGKAELKLTITGPRGNSLPFNINPTALGDHVIYTPRERGPHLIYVTYGGLDVPGCPIRQEIHDSSLATAYGDGLVKGVEDQEASFTVDVRGQRGDLDVRVDGPNSIAKSLTEMEPDGRYRVRYIPVEVGVYTITVKWNGREIEGSPFRPKIVDPRKVYLVGNWESIIDSNNQLLLKLNEMKTVEFDTRLAGPGQMTAEVRNADGPVPVEIVQKDRDRYAISFIPRTEGEHVVRIMWSGAMLPRCPISGVVQKPVAPAPAPSSADQQMVSRMTTQTTRTTTQQQQQQQQQQQLQNNSQTMVYSNDKVILSGTGLQTAKVNEHAEFLIDGTHAGPGTPSVRLVSTKGPVNIDCALAATNKYRCIYIPPTPGAYLLYVTWADRQLIGSPFKITVLPASDDFVDGMQSGTSSEMARVSIRKQTAQTTNRTTETFGQNSSGFGSRSGVSSGGGASKVICTAGNVKKCQLGQDWRSTVDTHLAGRGQLVAQCNGPTKTALCQLNPLDRTGEFYNLIVQPQEAGIHTLFVTFNSEPVPGSPFRLKVSGPPDPTKVSVTGPGIRDGSISTYQGVFYVSTKDAGRGELTVKIRGPKGAFNVEMEKNPSDHRTIICKYHPTEPGMYTVVIKWANVDVIGSPFNVHIYEPDVGRGGGGAGAEFSGRHNRGLSSRSQMASTSSAYYRSGGPNAAVNGHDPLLGD